MIAPEEDECRIGQAIVVELLEHVAHHVVHGGDVVVEPGPILTDDRRVGIVRRQGGLGRVMQLVSRQPGHVLPVSVFRNAHLALVAHEQVKDGEERHPRRTIPPMGLVAQFIPGRDGRGKVIVGLCVVGAVIARCSQVFRKAVYLGRRHALAAHMLGADGGGIHSRNDGGSAGRADTIGREGVGVAKALRREPVNVRGTGIGVAIAAEVRAGVLATHPQNIPRLSGRRLLGKQRSGGGEQLAACHRTLFYVTHEY